MAATIELVRRMALALPGVQKGVCFGTPAFYVGRRLMLRLREDGETLVVRYPREKRAALIEGNPDVFSVTDHYRNYPTVLVNLLPVNREVLGRMIEGAGACRRRGNKSRRAIAKAAAYNFFNLFR